MSMKSIWQRWLDHREKRWFRWVTDILIFVSIFTFVMYMQTSAHVGRGEPAPQLMLRAVDDTSFNLADSDKPTVIFFWAPWCGVCKADAHNVGATLDAVGDDANVVSVALSYESLEDVHKFIDENELRGQALLGTREVARDWSVDSFPTIYVVDSEGEIAYSMVGYTTEMGLRARLLTLGVF